MLIKEKSKTKKVNSETQPNLTNKYLTVSLYFGSLLLNQGLFVFLEDITASHLHFLIAPSNSASPANKLSFN